MYTHKMKKGNNKAVIIILLKTFVLILLLSGFNRTHSQEIADDFASLKSGSFMISGGVNNREDSIEVFFYKPENYTSDSRIIIVIPGGGRNGDSYRDAWIESAMTYNLLILSPSYSRKYYPKVKDYNLGRVSPGSLSEMSEAAPYDEEWILNDFDRMFDVAVQQFKSSREKYDVFGHSAGGQIAHRLALFNPYSKADRIVAANSGWYTLPDFNIKFPYGLKKVELSKEHLRNSFNQNLIILLGELDDENETRGHLRKTKLATQQGNGRLSRGAFFFQRAFQKSKEIQSTFYWKKEIVKDVGHSYRKMGLHAASILYSKSPK